MDRIADNGAESQSAGIDDEKVKRTDTPFEMTAPKRQAKHVDCKMNEIDVQEPVGDQSPVFVALQRRRIHGAILIEKCARHGWCARLAEADAGDDDICAEQ